MEQREYMTLQVDLKKPANGIIAGATVGRSLGRKAATEDGSIFAAAKKSSTNEDKKVDYVRNKQLWLEHNPEPKGFWNWLTGKHKKWEKEYLKLASSTWETMPTSEYEKTFSDYKETTDAPQETESPENITEETPINTTVRDASGLTVDDEGNPLSGVEKELDNDGNVQSYTIYASGRATKKVDYEYDSDGKLKGFNISRDLNADDYEIKNDKNIITVTDKNKTTAAKIDLNTLLQGFEQEDKDKIAAQISKMPAETLIDLYNENVTIGNFYKYDGSANLDAIQWASGFYEPDEDGIYIKEKPVTDTIIHELGHAIDWKRKEYEFSSGDILNYNDVLGTTDRDSEFKKIFNEELEAFKEAGYSADNCYAATNNHEAFAEAYTLDYTISTLGSREMTQEEVAEALSRYEDLPKTSGKSTWYATEEQYYDNDNSIYVPANTRYGYLLQYFPRTLGEAERLIDEAHQLTQEKRGEPIAK